MKTKKLTVTALFAAIATVLMYFEFPLPFMPPFLKVDMSGAVILIAVLTLGLKEGLFTLAIKDLIHLLSTQTGGVGELADFIMLSAMAVSLWLTVKYCKAEKKLLFGLCGAVFTLIVMGTITNKFMLIPFYSKIMPLEAILEMCRTVNPNVTSINQYILWGVVPFNAVKGIIVCLIASLLYKRMGNINK